MAFKCAKLRRLYCIDVRYSKLVVERNTSGPVFASTHTEVAEFKLEKIGEF